jgi:hypothetical protein
MNEDKDHLRDRSLMHLFLGLNVGLAAAFVVFLSLSRDDGP